jgi:hypothetical protein
MTAAVPGFGRWTAEGPQGSGGHTSRRFVWPNSINNLPLGNLQTAWPAAIKWKKGEHSGSTARQTSATPGRAVGPSQSQAAPQYSIQYSRHSHIKKVTKQSQSQFWDFTSRLSLTPLGLRLRS